MIDYLFNKRIKTECALQEKGTENQKNRDKKGQLKVLKEHLVKSNQGKNQKEEEISLILKEIIN